MAPRAHSASLTTVTGAIASSSAFTRPASPTTTTSMRSGASSDAAQARRIAAARRNERYLPEIPLPAPVLVTADWMEATAGTELALVATPVAGLRDVLDRMVRPLPFLWLCKGFEEGSALLPHEIVAETGATAPNGALSGPSFALEVARGLPCALTLASSDAAFSARAAALLHGARLRIYTSEDVLGVEISRPEMLETTAMGAAFLAGNGPPHPFRTPFTLPVGRRAPDGSGGTAWAPLARLGPTGLARRNAMFSSSVSLAATK